MRRTRPVMSRKSLTALASLAGLGLVSVTPASALAAFLVNPRINPSMPNLAPHLTYPSGLPQHTDRGRDWTTGQGNSSGDCYSRTFLRLRKQNPRASDDALAANARRRCGE